MPACLARAAIASTLPPSVREQLPDPHAVAAERDRQRARRRRRSARPRRSDDADLDRVRARRRLRALDVHADLARAAFPRARARPSPARLRLSFVASAPRGQRNVTRIPDFRFRPRSCTCLPIRTRTPARARARRRRHALDRGQPRRLRGSGRRRPGGRQEREDEQERKQADHRHAHSNTPTGRTLRCGQPRHGVSRGSQPGTASRYASYAGPNRARSSGSSRQRPSSGQRGAVDRRRDEQDRLAQQQALPHDHRRRRDVHRVAHVPVRAGDHELARRRHRRRRPDPVEREPRVRVDHHREPGDDQHHAEHRAAPRESGSPSPTSNPLVSSAGPTPASRPGPMRKKPREPRTAARRTAREASPAGGRG